MVVEPYPESKSQFGTALVNEQSTAWWRDLLVCPQCRERMNKLTRCDNCGSEYGTEEGAPRLICPELSAQITFRFCAKRSVISEDELLALFSDPADGEQRKGLPYHLDAAHAITISKLPQGSAVLEVGCGGSQTREWYEALGFRYIGTDISRYRVHEWLRVNGGADVLCDAHFLPFADGSFDVVYAAAVFEHLACPVRAVQEAARVLKPGGLLLGNVSFMEPWHDGSFFHMSPSGVIEMLKAGGLAPVKIWPSRGYDGFQALPRMSMKKLNPVRIAGWLLHRGYALEGFMLALARTLTSRRSKSALLRAAVVAGAIDWIAAKERP